jgi:hypothetical protein
MPYYKHERHGTHIAGLADRETLEKNGWVLVEENKPAETPAFLTPVDKEPETATIVEQVKHKPGRKPRITE